MELIIGFSALVILAALANGLEGLKMLGALIYVALTVAVVFGIPYIAIHFLLKYW